MPANCAVATCSSWARKEKKRADLGLSFFRFPKDPVIQAAWVHRCARQDFIYTKTASVCSLHFTVEDYDPSYLVKKNLMPNVKPRLKPDAIPSQNIPSHPTSKEEARAERCEQRKTAKEVAEALAVTCDPSPEQQSCTPQSVDAASTETQLRLQVRMLRKKLAQQATTHRRQREAWRRERVRLRREVRTLQVKAKACIQLQKEGVFSDQQIQRIATKRRVNWTAADVANAVGLRCVSRKAYGYVQRVMKIPMASRSTLSRWTRGFRMTQGIIEAAVGVMEAAVRGMERPMEKICVISFDEVSLDGRWCYDQMGDQAMAASKMQVLMVRGLCSGWKQPFFYAMDEPMTLEKLTEVVTRLEAIGLEVAAAVSDMHPSNEGMWRKAGVGQNRTWIEHPADHTRRLWVFADVPHLIKLLRRHVMEKDCGLLVPNSRGGRSLLSRRSFEEILALDSGELRICPKLTKDCIEASGQAGQRVYLATRCFSNTVATALATRVPGREEQARIVSTVNRWFDVLNSRAPHNAVPERCAYGITAETRAKQDAALDAMDACMREARKATRKHPLGLSSLLPCQQGVLRSIASLRGLHGDLRHRHPDVQYLMTSHLNQDCLENLFSQLRAMCGANVAPNAVEARARLRILLMAPSPLEAVNRRRPVQLEPDQCQKSGSRT